MCPVGTTGTPEKFNWGEKRKPLRGILFLTHNAPQMLHLKQLVLHFNISGTVKSIIKKSGGFYRNNSSDTKVHKFCK